MTQKTSIDWFGFRTKDGPDVITGSLSDCFPDRFHVSAAPRKTGWRSFERSYDLMVTDKLGNPETDCARVGMLMSGGDAVKGRKNGVFAPFTVQSGNENGRAECDKDRENIFHHGRKAQRLEGDSQIRFILAAGVEHDPGEDPQQVGIDEKDLSFQW